MTGRTIGPAAVMAVLAAVSDGMTAPSASRLPVPPPTHFICRCRGHCVRPFVCSGRHRHAVPGPFFVRGNPCGSPSLLVDRHLFGTDGAARCSCSALTNTDAMCSATSVPDDLAARGAAGLRTVAEHRLLFSARGLRIVGGRCVNARRALSRVPWLYYSWPCMMPAWSPGNAAAGRRHRSSAGRARELIREQYADDVAHYVAAARVSGIGSRYWRHAAQLRRDAHAGRALVPQYAGGGDVVILRSRCQSPSPAEI
jgi:hypothetical protein